MLHLAFQTTSQSANVELIHDDNIGDRNADGGTRRWRVHPEQHRPHNPRFTQIRLSHLPTFLQTFTTGENDCRQFPAEDVDGIVCMSL